MGEVMVCPVPPSASPSDPSFYVPEAGPGGGNPERSRLWCLPLSLVGKSRRVLGL